MEHLGVINIWKAERNGETEVVLNISTNFGSKFDDAEARGFSLKEALEELQIEVENLE